VTGGLVLVDENVAVPVLINEAGGLEVGENEGADADVPLPHHRPPDCMRLASRRAAASWAGESLSSLSGATPTVSGHPVASSWCPGARCWARAAPRGRSSAAGAA
jgi:hypothetical protein